MTHTRKLFTPAEASRMLPLVRRIVEDILATGRGMRANATRTPPDAAQVQDYMELAVHMRELVAELEALGCQYKDWSFELGLVDFPSVLDGRMVLLCWRSDEPEILFYHGEEDGYAGRRPIPPSLRAVGVRQSTKPVEGDPHGVC